MKERRAATYIMCRPAPGTAGGGGVYISKISALWLIAPTFGVRLAVKDVDEAEPTF